MNSRKNIISIFFLLTFLLIRIVDAHSFSHLSEDDHQNHCELCEIIPASLDDTPFFDNTFIEVQQKPFIYFGEYRASFCYETSQYSITLPKSIYNKPPPVKS